MSVMFVSLLERTGVPSHWRLKGQKNASKKQVMPKDCICHGGGEYLPQLFLQSRLKILENVIPMLFLMEFILLETVKSFRYSLAKIFLLRNYLHFFLLWQILQVQSKTNERKYSIFEKERKLDSVTEKEVSRALSLSLSSRSIC